MIQRLNEIPCDVLDRLDREILSVLRSVAKTRKAHWLREGSETGCIFERVTTAFDIARARGINRGRKRFVWNLVKSRIPHLVATGAISRQPRITSAGRAIAGYSVPTADVRLTANDHRFLAALLVRWD